MSAPSTLGRTIRDYARSWRRVLRTARATPPARWVEASAVDPRCPHADSAYNGLCTASDGRVYFALSTHRPNASAIVGCLDPEHHSIAWSTELAAVVGGDPRDARTHAKVHVAIEDANGRLYVATIAGDHAAGGPDAFPGFRIVSVDPTGASWIVHARGPRGEGVISGRLDARRRVYHALTHPSGLYCRCDLETGDVHVSHIVPDALPRGLGAQRNPSTPVCRALGLDPGGTVFGSCHDGSIWRCDPEGEPHLMSGVNVFDGMVPPVDQRGRASGLWRAVTWDDAGSCFYGIHGATGSLFRFDPGAARVEPIARLGPVAQHGSGHAPFRSQLGLVLHGRTIYHLAHGASVRDDNGPLPERSVFLTSYALDSHTFREHGPVRTRNGDRLLFAESLAADDAGTLYTSGWVECRDPVGWGRDRAERAIAASGECRGETYRMMLLQIPRGAR